MADKVKTANFITDDKGIVWAYTGPPLTETYMGDRAHMLPVCIPHPDFANVVGASMLLYESVKATKTAMSTFVDVLEEIGADQLVFEFQRIAANLNLAQRAAEEGLQNLFPPQSI